LQRKSESISRIHVALITPGFPADESDTPCIPALQEYLRGLIRYVPDVEVSVLALRYPHRKEPYHWWGLQVFPSGGRQRRFPAIVPSWLDLMRNFRRLHKRKRVDLIHGLWLGECALLGTMLGRAYGLPQVVTLMGQDVRLKRRYHRLLDSPRNTIVGLSEFQRRDLLAQGRDVARIIPWGIEAVASPQSEQPRDIDLLGVGSLVAVKDFERFLRVVAILHAAKPDLRCVIAGDGTERPRLQGFLRLLNIQGSVRFEGGVKRERVLELMARSRVLLHTSSYESYGFVFVEALAGGARIVSGPVGIAQAGPSWAVEETVPALAAAVERFWAQPTPKPSFPYPIEGTVQIYHSLYQQVAGARVIHV
jgi:glycosyltransferase involved in cell wall biosynthesis